MRRLSCRLTLFTTVSLLLTVTALAHAATPIMGGVEFDRRAVHNAPGWRMYSDVIYLSFSDADGASDIASAELTGPQGQVWPAWLLRPEHPYEHRVEAEITTPESPVAPPEGLFTVTVRDKAGHRASRQFHVHGATAGFLEPVFPVPDTIVPAGETSFRCRNGEKATVDTGVVSERDCWKPVWQGEAPGSDKQVAPTSAEAPKLQAGYTYIWRAQTRIQKPTDHGVQLWQEQVLRVRCRTLGQTPTTGPSLPGTLYYGYYFAGGALDTSAEGIVPYQPDFTKPAWLGPVGVSYPDLSPDGKQLLYVSTNALWLDSMDGTPPRRLADGFCRDPRWSPDMKQIVFVRGESLDYSGAPTNLDIWLINPDGSNAHPLVATKENNERFPCWSPDGKWIVYRSIPGPSPDTSLYEIRPDGRDNHAIIGGLLVGHPEWGAACPDWADWSPDGAHLLVTFFTFGSASADHQDHSGVGVMSPEGGPVTPVFIVPPGGDGNAPPSAPKWSPDGKYVAFASAFHCLGSKEDTYPRPEVWVMRADGSGEPIRLSYDYSRVNSIRWIAP